MLASNWLGYDRTSHPIISTLRLASARIHHPKRAARLGTPVRERFCIGRLNLASAKEVAGTCQHHFMVDTFLDTPLSK